MIHHEENTIQTFLINSKEPRKSYALSGIVAYIFRYSFLKPPHWLTYKHNQIPNESHSSWCAMTINVHRDDMELGAF